MSQTQASDAAQTDDTQAQKPPQNSQTPNPVPTLQQEVADLQVVTSAPVVIGQLGKSIDGSDVDQYGMQAVNALFLAVDAFFQSADSGLISGGAVWLPGSHWSDAGDILSDNNGNLTDYGQAVADWIGTDENS